MRLLILFILFLVSQIGNGQIISASPSYRWTVVAASCSYPLDTYTGAKGAYSLRKIRTAYAGSAIRVRRSSDDTESDIGFDGCELDEAALATFVGANSGYIVTWYDQQNSNDASQATAGNQPRIVNAGTIHTVNGKPAIYFDGSDDFLESANMAAEVRIDAYFLTSTSDATYLHFYGTSGGVGYGFAASSGSGSAALYGGFGTPTLYANNTVFAGSTRGDVYTALNGTKIVTIQAANTTDGAWTSGGNKFKMFGYSGFAFDGYCPEMIIWDSDQSANRAGIVAAINSFYSVY